MDLSLTLASFSTFKIESYSCILERLKSVSVNVLKTNFEGIEDSKATIGRCGIIANAQAISEKLISIAF